MFFEFYNITVKKLKLFKIKFEFLFELQVYFRKGRNSLFALFKGILTIKIRTNEIKSHLDVDFYKK